mmetsp:Transcript_13466/g.29521  ORF Transcript_13466/g.29521 Transcript_13466/m.29521 type:complete len:84 (+) Transcript_13466:684-935(+)
MPQSSCWRALSLSASSTSGSETGTLLEEELDGLAPHDEAWTAVGTGQVCLARYASDTCQKTGTPVEQKEATRSATTASPLATN